MAGNTGIEPVSKVGIYCKYLFYECAAGFEPARDFSNGFADRYIRPLCQTHIIYK